MFKKIMVPVHHDQIDHMNHALAVAAEMAQRHDAEVCYVAVTSRAPGPSGRTPEAKAEALAAFAAEQAQTRSIAHVSSHLELDHDPTAQLGAALLAALDTVGADLVVMASHMPGWSDIVTGNHGGWMATHAQCSVFVVRD